MLGGVLAIKGEGHGAKAPRGGREENLWADTQTMANSRQGHYREYKIRPNLEHDANKLCLLERGTARTCDIPHTYASRIHSLRGQQRGISYHCILDVRSQVRKMPYMSCVADVDHDVWSVVQRAQICSLTLLIWTSSVPCLLLFCPTTVNPSQSFLSSLFLSCRPPPSSYIFAERIFEAFGGNRPQSRRPRLDRRSVSA